MEQHLKQSSPFGLFLRLISTFWQRSTTRRQPVNQAEGSVVWLRAMLSVVICSLLLGTGGLATAKETVTYIHSDISGSPLAATDAAGNVLWKESYFAYGQKTEWQPESEAQTQWFHGKEQDADTTMQYFGARYYDPGIGRFLGIDPVDYQDGNLHSFNRYAYGNNNPVRFKDPDGAYAEVALEALSLAIGLDSLGKNYAAGNYGAAAVDILGISADAILTAVPVAPGVAGIAIKASRGNGAVAPIHHICTNKNCVSAASGGPWTPRFKDIFDKAGMSLDDGFNKIAVLGHKGPHPEIYHRAVFDRLSDATKGLNGAAYRNALQNELTVIGKEIQTPGSILNNLVTKP